MINYNKLEEFLISLYLVNERSFSKEIKPTS